MSKAQPKKPGKSRNVQFPPADKARVMDYSRKQFRMIFSETYPEVSFDICSIESPEGWFYCKPFRATVRAREVKASARKNLDKILESYGFDEKFRGFVDWAINIPGPKKDRDIERTAFVNWFEYLEVLPGKLNVKIPEDGRIKITVDLLEQELRRTVTPDAVEQKYRRWVKGRYGVKSTFHIGKKKSVKVEILRGRATLTR